MNNKTCLILGSNSDVGKTLAHIFAKNGFNMLLACRNIDETQHQLCADLQNSYGISSQSIHFEGSLYDGHMILINELKPFPDVVISVFGYLGDHDHALDHFDETHKILASNFIGHVSVLNLVANKMKQRGSGTIIGISSVAGERGRQSNFIYGSAKAGLTAYLSGLRNWLSSSNIHVITVKPGFIRTKMIAGIASPDKLTASPAQVGNAIWKAFVKKRNVIYVFSIWRYIMFLIKCIPESVFKRMKL